MATRVLRSGKVLPTPEQAVAISRIARIDKSLASIAKKLPVLKKKELEKAIEIGAFELPDPKRFDEELPGSTQAATGFTTVGELVNYLSRQKAVISAEIEKEQQRQEMLATARGALTGGSSVAAASSTNNIGMSASPAAAAPVDVFTLDALLAALEEEDESMRGGYRKAHRKSHKRRQSRRHRKSRKARKTNKSRRSH